MSDIKKLSCSFCAKQQNQVKKLIAGPDVFICDDCVNLCSDMLKSEATAPAKDEQAPQVTDDLVPSTRKIKQFLDQYVIGQDDTKVVLSVVVNSHYKRLANPIIDGVEIEKSNVLLLGPSGSGKTLLAQSIAKMLDVPFAIADATSLTEAGYVGDDVETIITRLLMSADGDVAKAERGIIYLDEVDKKSKKGENMSVSRDVSGEGVQQALLKIIEGADVRVSMQGNRKHPQSDMLNVNTRNILFIVGGAFVGLNQIIEKRVNTHNKGIGFGATITLPTDITVDQYLSQVEPEDLVKFGLIPELVGRLPIITHLEELTEEQLIRVLQEPKNAIIKQFVRLFGLEKVELVFELEALAKLAQHAIKRKTGARGLRSILEKKLIPIQFKLADLRNQGVRKIIITADVIDANVSPLYIGEDGVQKDAV